MVSPMTSTEANDKAVHKIKQSAPSYTLFTLHVCWAILFINLETSRVLFRKLSWEAVATIGSSRISSFDTYFYDRIVALYI